MKYKLKFRTQICQDLSLVIYVKGHISNFLGVEVFKLVNLPDLNFKLNTKGYPSSDTLLN